MGRSTRSDKFGCSRRSIYRALKELKEQGYLVETKKRENRCKVYELKAVIPAPRIVIPAQAGIQNRPPDRLDPSLRWDDKMERQGDKIALCTQAKFWLDNCRNVLRYNFPESFDWEKFFPEATHKIRHVEHQTKFWRLMFDNLYLIQERETGKPHSARTDNPDSTLFGVSYPKVPPAERLEYIMRTRPSYRS
ncbi:MAG: helix-turn-helix domain-containing protein [Deltaproteobacteria bacterium]|nr:helix-turn-helix domain-containing protein [Deltaproteobacteria bacterium]